MWYHHDSIISFDSNTRDVKLDLINKNKFICNPLLKANDSKRDLLRIISGYFEIYNKVKYSLLSNL